MPKCLENNYRLSSNHSTLKHEEVANMKTRLGLAALLIVAGAAAVVPAAEPLRGQYVEARTCDVWVGACFANAEMNLTGKHAILAWKLDTGSFHGVTLDGLSVVAVVEATDTLGLPQTGPAKAILIVDANASPSQRQALVALARKLGGDLLANILSVQAKPIAIDINCCKEGGCAKVDAGVARIETRCLHDCDRICGHEDNFYPPLTEGVNVKAAMISESSFSGKAFNKTWTDAERRGAYVGSFSLSR
jgi:hypothetical protein